MLLVLDHPHSSLRVLPSREAPAFLQQATSDGRGCVLHVGPDPRTLGGIASVIKELVSVEPGANVGLACPSWSPHSQSRGLASLPQCARAIWQLSRIRTTQTVVHVHLSERGSFIREGALAAWASLLGMPTVATLHGADFYTFAESSPRLTKAVLGRIATVLTLGPRMAALVRRLLPDTQVVVVSNPVGSQPTLESKERANHPSGVKAIGHDYVLFAGELGTRKGLDRLLASWPSVHRRYPDLRLVLCGPTGDMDLDRLPDGVLAIGPLPRDEALEIIAAAVLVCLPSRREVLPMVLLEAAILGVPQVATEVGEVGSLRHSGGTIVLPADGAGLSESLVQLLADRTRLLDMGTQAKDWAMAQASSLAVRDQLDQVYTSVRAARRTQPTDS